MVLVTHKYDFPVPLGVTANSTHLFSSPWELRESRGTHKVVCCHCCRVARAQKDGHKSLVSGFLRITSVMMWSANKDHQSLHQLWEIGSVSDHIDGPYSAASPPPKSKRKNKHQSQKMPECSMSASIAAMMPFKLPCQSHLHCELQKPLVFSSETVPTFIRVQFYLYFLRTPSPFLLFPLCLVL